MPQCAIESAVPDWVVYELVRFMKEELAGKAKDVKLTVQFM